MPQIGAVQRIADRVLAHAPDAVQIPWARETWAGTHGAAGLTASVTKVGQTAILGDGTLYVKAAADGVVRTPAGEPVGLFERATRLRESGHLTVEHDELKLDAAYRGTGFARSFNDHAIARYEAAGVQDVTLYAGMSVGGYAWARQGFEILGAGATPELQLANRARKISDLVELAWRDQRITPRQHAQLAARLIDDTGIVRPDTLTSVQELAAMPGIGKRVLLGADWSGIRHLQPQRLWHEPPSAISDAASAARLVGGVDAVPAAVRDAARAAAAELPPVLDTTHAVRAIEHATARAGDPLVALRGHAVTTVTSGDREASVRSSIHFARRGDAAEMPVVFVDGSMRTDGTIAIEATATDRPFGDGARGELDSALRSLGAHDITVVEPRFAPVRAAVDRPAQAPAVATFSG